MDNEIKEIRKRIEERIRNDVLNEVKDIVENKVAFVAKKNISSSIREQVYKKDFGGSRNLRVGNFGKIENLKSYVSVNTSRGNSIINLKIRNETPPNSIFNSPIHSDYPGLLGYWIEVGSIPVLWDNGDNQYVNKTFKFTDKNGVEHTIMKAFPPRPWMSEAKEQLKSYPILRDVLEDELKQKRIIK